MIGKLKRGTLSILSIVLLFAAVFGSSVAVSPEPVFADEVVRVADDDDAVIVDEDDDGVFETIFDGIGYIIALPFRIVAGVVEAIF